jgi:UDP-glucose 4-epimerase
MQVDEGGWAGVRALVLGATGFIGRRVAAALQRNGADVVLCGRDAHALDALSSLNRRAAVRCCDAASPQELEAVLRSVRPAVTFNLAGYGVDRTERDDATAERMNAELPARLVRLLAAHRHVGWRGSALVHVGSAAEYGNAGGALREDGVATPSTLYGRTKLAGTLAVAGAAEETGVATVTARLFTVYGPGEHEGRLLPSLLDTARTRMPLLLTAGLQRRDFTHVDDVVEGLLGLARASMRPGELVNLATGRLETVRGFAERAAHVLGVEPELLRFGAVETRPDEMEHEPVSIDRLRTLMCGWAPSMSIEEGVLRTAREQNGMTVNA